MLQEAPLRLYIGQPGKLENYPLLNQYIPGAPPTNTGNYVWCMCYVHIYHIIMIRK